MASLFTAFLISCAPSIATVTRARAATSSRADAALDASATDGGNDASATSAPSATSVGRARGLVTRRGVCLVRDGARLRLVGSSAFHLQEESARRALGWTGSLHTVRRTFERAQANGVRALRVAAFNERVDDAATIQSALGVLREPGLVALDRVIAEAAEQDVLLVMVLSNYWGDYGGFPRYLEWLGLPSDYDHRALTMREPRFRQALAGYFSAIVRRRNTVTGRTYGEEPTILAWELVNEPRGTNLGDGGATFASFLHELAVAVKQAGARQLVVAGDEGYDADTRGYDARYWNHLDDRLLNRARGESFRRVVSDPAIDAATVHWYPDHWRVPSAMAREGGARWLREHAAIAAQWDKPVLFEEFGLMAPRHPSLEARRDAYEYWLATALSIDAVAAAMPWGLHWNPDFHERDGFEWGARDGDDDPYGAIVQRFSERFAADTRLDGCTQDERRAALAP
jgi:mannan endo-1,4-beta-mannosidase